MVAQSFTDPAFVPTDAAVLLAGINICSGMPWDNNIFDCGIPWDNRLPACNICPFLKGWPMIHRGTCLACAVQSKYKERLTKTDSICFVHELEFHSVPVFADHGGIFYIFLRASK